MTDHRMRNGKSGAPCGLAALHGERARVVAARRQGGVVLIIALIVLVAVTLAGIALVRSVDTGNMVAGNLAFKQGATAVGDAGTEAAIGWLNTVAGTSGAYNDQPDQGYYATSQDNLDVTGNSNDPNRALVDWDFNNCNGRTTSACLKPVAGTSPDPANSVTYIINRLCLTQGDPNSTGNSCANYKSTGTASPKRGELKYGDDKRFEPLPAEYYRITSRVKGPRNTVSFVETVIHY